MTNGPILILEDDPDDQEILEIIFTKLEVKNARIYFTIAKEFLAFLLTTREQPFLIISDINVGGITGMEIKNQIEANIYLQSKTIPFLFLTTSSNPLDVRAAYDLHAQGYFVKQSEISKMSEMMLHILNYWQVSLHPNNI